MKIVAIQEDETRKKTQISEPLEGEPQFMWIPFQYWHVVGIEVVLRDGRGLSHD